MAISQTLGISQEEAMEIEENYYKMFKGISSFKAKGSKYVRTHGHVVMCRHTGHKMYWWDHDGLKDNALSLLNFGKHIDLNIKVLEMLLHKK